MVQETISRNVNWDEGSERLVKQSLLVGELENAARVALKSGRATEALLIAEAGGQDLYEKIKSEYFQLHRDPFVKDVIKSISEKDFEPIINLVTQPNFNPESVQCCNWKEALAYIISYQREDEAKLREVSKKLGD